MLLWVYLALASYVVSIGFGLAGMSAASAAAGAISTVLVGITLTKAYRELLNIRDMYWDKLGGVWLGGEYVVAIWLFVISGVSSQPIALFLVHQFEILADRNVEQIDFTKLMGLGALVLGLLLLVAVWIVAWAYLIEVFTRDIYIVKVATGVGTFRPSSATFYIVLSVITIGFLYFYWLYSVWKWISQLKTSTKLPHLSQSRTV
ncbi:hypothetical protein [Pyrobaculum islandicum]|uniref:hypothetical protein n=1 Tax=Pyrobaculum islandicum TaxID=2277 RepID=UPI001FD76CB4|nr:hypothetical protein [Pyrobaculum islandicum]